MRHWEYVSGFFFSGYFSGRSFCDVVAKNELDTRADTFCAGTNSCCLRPMGMTCSVHGFHHSFAPIPEIPVATVATAWDDQNTMGVRVSCNIGYELWLKFPHDVG
jgi:hypothetical protein